MGKVLDKKASFTDGRKGYIHIIRDTINRKRTMGKFTYKDVEEWVKKFYPKNLFPALKIRRTTIIASLTSMADPAVGELEVVELGKGCIATKYRRIA